MGSEKLEGPGHGTGEVTQGHRAPGMGMDLTYRMTKNVKIDRRRNFRGVTHSISELPDLTLFKHMSSVINLPSCLI